MPIPDRPLTALLARYNGKSILIDCGEGTQTVIRQKGLSMKPIDVIFFTHFHADHIAGLPGFLLTMGKMGRTEPITLVGPSELEHYVKSLCVIAPELPFELKFVEIDSDEQVFPFGDLVITAFEVDHAVACYGYSIELRRKGKFNPEKARSLGIEPRLWGRLQNGENIEANGSVITSDMVMGEPRKGLKVTYCTDTRPTDSIVQHAKNADLFICEGMYAENEKLEKAIENKHTLFSEAAEMAQTASVRRLWLTHYSPSLSDPAQYLDDVRQIFHETETPESGMEIELKFDEN